MVNKACLSDQSKYIEGCNDENQSGLAVVVRQDDAYHSQLMGLEGKGLVSHGMVTTAKY